MQVVQALGMKGKNSVIETTAGKSRITQIHYPEEENMINCEGIFEG